MAFFPPTEALSRRKGALALLPLLCLLSAAGAQAGPRPDETRTNVIMPPAPLLPGRAADLTAGPTTAGDASGLTAQTMAGPGCSPAISGAPASVGCGVDIAAILKEDGLTRYAAAQYSHAGGATLPVFALQFGDATGAYSAYTLYRSLAHGARITSTAGAVQGKAAEITTDADGILVWDGVTVLRVAGRPSSAELAALQAGLPKTGGRNGLPPRLPFLAPTRELDPASVRYAVGPAAYAAMNPVLPASTVDWTKSPEALWGSYSGRGAHDAHGTVTLMFYPTPQIAGTQGRVVEKYLNDHGAASFGTVKLRRVGPLLAFSSGALGAEQAASLVGGVSLREDITFDKQMQIQPQFDVEVHKTLTLLQSIALFSGLGLVAALVIGGFLGAGRAGWRVMHGKSAASDPEFLTINLRDQPKGLFAGRNDNPEER